ncbi:hypothetical protein APHAL10511_002188 [Amanita phalloides]|nr:hypothetical protein APHAL10511_002188 [Amanita phalloides]
MAAPVTGVKYRILNVDFLTYIEALDQGTADVRLRPWKESKLQYWEFETVPGNVGFYYVRNVGNNKRCLYCDGSSITATTPTTTYSLAKIWYENGSYRLTVRYSTTDYYVNPDDYGALMKATSTKNDTDKQKWQLITVASPPSVPIYEGILQTGNYRIRNLDGKSLFTLPDKKFIGAVNLFVRPQRSEADKLRAYQRWIVTRQESGDYTIQNAGNNSYLGCTVATPTVGDSLVGLENIYIWKFQSIGGFAWSIRLPSGGLSVGSADNDIEDEDEMSLVPSDNTSSQIWFMEKYIPLGKDQIHAKREIQEGTYVFQSAHDSSIYMKAISNAWRIAAATTAPSKFKLEYVDANSAHFTLTYTTAATKTTAAESKIVADTGGFIGLNDDGTEFVLLEKDKDDPGFVICRPDPGHPHKVVTSRTKIDGNGNSVFAIDNLVAGEALQMWKLIPSTA